MCFLVFACDGNEDNQVLLFFFAIQVKEGLIEKQKEMKLGSVGCKLDVCTRDTYMYLLSPA